MRWPEYEPGLYVGLPGKELRGPYADDRVDDALACVPDYLYGETRFIRVPEPTDIEVLQVANGL